jgi:hypothetical protein
MREERYDNMTSFSILIVLLFLLGIIIYQANSESINKFVGLAAQGIELKNGEGKTVVYQTNAVRVYILPTKAITATWQTINMAALVCFAWRIKHKTNGTN